MTTEPPERDLVVPSTEDGRWLGLGLVAALVILAGLRIVVDGWAPPAADDARYLNVGLSILEGRGPVTPSGTTYLLRSPVYGLTLATVSTLIGGDPIVGARLAALVIGLLGLAGALRLGWLLAGPGSAVGTALALVASSLIWRLIPSLRIDLPQTAAIVATLLLVWRPTTLRWALGGVMLGIAILVKETALPLLILPVAFIGSMPAGRLTRLSAIFVVSAALTAGWWWILVWVSTGEVFPLNALDFIEARDVDVALRIDRSTAGLIAVAIAGWALVAWRVRRSIGARLLLVSGVGLAPAALYAASLGLDSRNFASLAVLSAVAVGAGGAWLVADLRARLASAESSGRRRLVIMVLLALAVVATAAPVVGQRDAVRLGADGVGDELATWLPANFRDGGRIVMAFREHEQTALRLRGRADVDVLPIARVDPTEPPKAYLWMGLRDRQLFGYRREAWIASLTEPNADMLALVGPHPFTPLALTASPATAALLGLLPVTILGADGDRAEVLRVDPAAVASGTPDVALHLSASAAETWLDLAGSDAAGRLAEAHPVVDGEPGAIAALLERIGDAACSMPAGPDSVTLAPAGTCPD